MAILYYQWIQPWIQKVNMIFIVIFLYVHVFFMVTLRREKIIILKKLWNSYFAVLVIVKTQRL